MHRLTLLSLTVFLLLGGCNSEKKPNAPISRKRSTSILRSTARNAPTLLGRFRLIFRRPS
jgi:hypothetical protein